MPGRSGNPRYHGSACQKYFDDVSIEIVEIDHKITNLAREYFELPDTVKVTTYDGWAYPECCE
jgi:spermidine synthase